MRAVDLECELREMAGLVSGADLSGDVLERVRKARAKGVLDVGESGADIVPCAFGAVFVYLE